MPTVKLNKTELEKIPYPAAGEVVFYWDSSLRGFGLRVTPGAKTYIAEGRLNGNTCRVKIGRHGPFTPDAARNAAMAILRSISEGKNPNEAKRDRAVEGVTLAEAFIQFKESRNLRPKTIAIYDSVMRRCFPDWQDHPVTSITKDMVEKRHREISDKNGPRGKGEAQAHQAMRTLRAIINFVSVKYETADGLPIIAINPVKRLTELDAWNKVPRRQSVIQTHQLKRWVAAVAALDNRIVRDYLLLLLFTGLRRTEAATLEWSDIDFEAKTLSIPAKRTKTNSEHRLPLSDFLYRLLKQRHKICNQQNSLTFVFPGSGKTGHTVEPKRQIQQVIKASGVQFMSHDLRRTFLSIAESQDVSHYALKRLANHADASDVTAGYIVNDVERLRQPLQKVTSHIMSKAGIRFPQKKGIQIQFPNLPKVTSKDKQPVPAPATPPSKKIK